MDIEKLKRRKKELGYTNQQVADLSGVPLGTVQKFFGNVTVSPRRDTYLAIKDALERELPYSLDLSTPQVREEALYYGTEAAVKKQGEYTIEDYLEIPDERRVELIDGCIYDMSAAPNTLHQMIAGEVYHQLRSCAERHELSCMPFMSPIDVQLDCDNRTMVQPDVIILCDMNKLLWKRVYGAPEFVMEVLSPSTRNKDMITKLNKYINAGCLEYWVVDPDNEQVMTYDFRKGLWPVIYSIKDKVPVAISDGKCEIDFSEVYRVLEMSPHFYDEDEE
ncbi:MAG: Uma2 family endonuclease [Firmicutes bacterium]|nr:Uma2 family endonuclease [Bacillota bacterium]